MKKLITFFVKYPIWANTIIGLTIIFGLVSFTNINQSFFPETPSTQISISVAYPGASPEEMEQGVTSKIEDALKGIVGIDEITSTSSENVSSIMIETFEDVDLDEVLADVKNAVDRINNLPEDAEAPVIFKIRRRSFVGFVGLSGDVSVNTLKIAAEKIEDDLLNSNIVSQVNIQGIPETEISVEVSKETLERYGITIDMIASAVRNNNRDISAGSIKSEDEEVLIRSRAKHVSAEKIGDIILKAENSGDFIRIRDIATVKEQFADTYEKVEYKGNKSITFIINKLGDEDLKEISAFVNSYINDFNSKHENLHLIKYFDFKELLNDRIDMLVKNGMMGIIFVIITLGMFLNLRLSFWVAFGLPASFIGMFMVMAYFGLTINMMTLFGMILIVGILVDDGIVIAENIYAHFEQGKNAFQAAIDGSMEVLSAVFTSVLTTCVAFVPLMFLEGSSFAKELAIVVIAALLFSLVEAFFILPTHLASRRVLKPPKEKGIYTSLRKGIDKGLYWLRDKVYDRLLCKLLRNRYISATIPAVFLMIIVGLVGGGFIKLTFFPNVEFDDLAVDVVFKPGEREMKTERFIEDFEQKVQEVNSEIREEIGSDVIKYSYIFVGQTRNLGDSGPHTGHVYMSLDIEDKPISSYEIASRIKDKIGTVKEAEKLQIAGRQRFGKPVSVGISGDNYKEIELAVTELKEMLSELPDLKDISDNTKTGYREIQLDLKPEAYFLGLNHATVTKQIRQGFYGEEVQRLQRGNDEIKVWVRFPENDRLNLGQLEQMKIKTSDGREFYLKDLVDYTIERGVVSINHSDSKREVQVDADLKDPYQSVPPILEKVKTDFEPVLKAKYPGLTFTYGGQSKRATKTQNSMMTFFPLSLLIIFVLVMLNFRSFTQAWLILAMIPLAVGCAFLGHFIEGLPISVLSFMGIIALSGVVINDAIVFLDKYNSNLNIGMSVLDAAHSAGKARFRPILLTSITTVAGLFPLILETSFQAQFVIPMAVSMAYGVLFGTIFILLFFPVIILLHNDTLRIWKWLVSGNYPTDTEVEPTITAYKRLKERMSRINEIFTKPEVGKEE